MHAVCYRLQEVPSSCDITDSETDDVASPSTTETRMSANEATIGAQLEEELISKSVDVHRRAVAVRKMPRDGKSSQKKWDD